MIDAKTEPLTDTEDRELKTWFSKGPFHTLLKVLDSKVKELQSKASNEAMNGTEGYLAKGNVTLDQARQFQITRDILLQIAQQQEKYSVIRLS